MYRVPGVFSYSASDNLCRISSMFDTLLTLQNTLLVMSQVSGHKYVSNGSNKEKNKKVNFTVHNLR